MESPTYNQLLEAGVHFGHLKRKWNPKMKPYIFMERKGVHIIDLNRTTEKMNEAAEALKQIAKSGRKIMFVATKKQAREIVKSAAMSVDMPYVTERWLGGMMTNFATIKKSIKKMNTIDKMLVDEKVAITKKERLMVTRERAKLERNLSGVAKLNRTPAAIFIVDVLFEHIALKEADKLGVKTFAMVDTNSNPNSVDFAIPSNDDAAKSIKLVVDTMVSAIQDGLNERRKEKDAKAPVK